MPDVNLLYNGTTGRILSANLNSQTPIPSGHAIVLKAVANVSDVFGKRIRPDTLELVDKDFLKFDSATVVPKATVVTAVFTKRDGETEAPKVDPLDNEVVQISARQPDFSFDALQRRAFFDVLTTQLVSGAGQVKVATGLAPGKEMVVTFHDTLRPAFTTVEYV